MEAEMVNGHTHVIKTTADKLASELDSWLERPDDPGSAVSTDYTVQHVGGRDWVIVLRHAHEPGETSPEREPWISTASEQAFSKLGLIAGEYEDKTAIGPDGVKTPSDIAGWVEDRDRTWIMWIDRTGRPHCLWTKRDESGGVVGNAVNLTSELTWPVTYNTSGTSSTIAYSAPLAQIQQQEEISPWLRLASRSTVVWKNVLEGDVLDWGGSVRVVQRIASVGTVNNGVPCVHAQLGLEDGGSQFVVRGEHEQTFKIVRLDKHDLDWVRRGEFAQVDTSKYRGTGSLDPHTMERRLCDADGVVSGVELEVPNMFTAGLTYLEQLNNLRAHTGLEPVKEPFACTGSAHLAGEHIRCTSPAHKQEDKS